MNITPLFRNILTKAFPMFFIVLFCLVVAMPQTLRAQSKMVNITGTVTDFNNQPIAGADVFVQDADFKDLFHVTCDAQGHYTLRVPAGSYPYLSAIREENYPNSPRFNGKVADARLEFWSWGFIADRDTTVNIRYHRMEAYGVNVFRVQGATPAYQIYVRPMSLTRYATWMSDQTQPSHLAPKLDRLKVEVEIDGEPVDILFKQPVLEYASATQTLDAFLLTVKPASKMATRPYNVFRIVLEDLDNGDKGEALYYMKK